jgi:HEAT repeat protein
LALLLPGHYSSTPPPLLLKAAEDGLIAADHRFIRAVLERYEEFVPELVRAGLRFDEPAIPLAAVALDVFRFRPSAGSLPFLIEAFRRENEDVLDELAEAFCRLGEPALGPLLDLYGELGPERGGEVAFMLAELGVRDQRIIDLLLSRLVDDPEDGAFLLGVYGDPAAIPALQTVLEHRGAEEAARCSELQSAIEALREARPAAALEAYEIWADYPEEAGPHFHLLGQADRLGFLDSPVPEHRLEACRSLTGLDEDDGKTARQRVFELAQNDPDPAVRGAAWAALRGCAKHEPIGMVMRQRLQDQEAPLSERCGALLGLSFEDDPKVRGAMLELYEIPEARASALEAMWRSSESSFGPYFSRHLDDPSLDIRREAVAGVGFLRMHSEAGRLERYFHDDDLRAEALYAYALAAPGKVTALHARTTFAKIEELAGGLSAEEGDMVGEALNQLLESCGRRRLAWGEEHSEEREEPLEGPVTPGRNDACPCGSGKKYKKCCGA